jgi:hypothetical protein
MKKLMFALFAIGISFSSYSQELGIRFGNVAGGNVAVDGLFSTGKFSRVHANLAFGNNGFGVEGVWNFLYKPLGGEAFFWYVGVGASMRIEEDKFLLGPNGEIGLEYKFNTIPISLSGDWRPRFWIVENTDFDAGGFGFNIRYVFGNKK